MNDLRTTIMRRVYYAYFVERLMSIRTILLLTLALALYAMSLVVSFSNVFQNALNVRVRELDVFIYNAFANTEVWTYLLLALCALCVYAFVRVGRTLTSPRISFS